MKGAKKILSVIGIGLLGLSFYESIETRLGQIFFFYMCLIIAIPTITFVLKVLLVGKIKEKTYKEKSEKKKLRMAGNSTFQNDGDYLKVKSLFGELMSTKQLSRADVLLFKKELNKHLGNHAKVYMNKNFAFENDAHEIYIKLKSKELNMLDYQQLYKFLKSLQYGQGKLKEVK